MRMSCKWAGKHGWSGSEPRLRSTVGAPDLAERRSRVPPPPQQTREPLPVAELRTTTNLHTHTHTHTSKGWRIQPIVLTGQLSCLRAHAWIGLRAACNNNHDGQFSHKGCGAHPRRRVVDGPRTRMVWHTTPTPSLRSVAWSHAPTITTIYM